MNLLRQVDVFAQRTLSLVVLAYFNYELRITNYEIKVVFRGTRVVEKSEVIYGVDEGEEREEGEGEEEKEGEEEREGEERRERGGG